MAGAPLNEPPKISSPMGLPKPAVRLAPLGLPAAQLAALLYSLRPPLWLAVQLGACDAAAALVAAGAELGVSSYDSAWGTLIKLATAKSAAAGTPAAASRSVPQLVQRMAALLLEARPLSAPSMDACHAAAAALAFPCCTQPPCDDEWPCDWAPPCPWLLERLLQLHTSGEVPATEETAQALQFLSTELLQERPNEGAVCPASLEALVVQWLRVPAAQHLSRYGLLFLGQRVCQRSLTAAALPELLQLPGVSQALAEVTQHLPRGDEWMWQQDVHPHTLVVAAASTGQPGALDAVLAAGGAVTLQALNNVMGRVGWRDGGSSLATLRLLLSRHVPPVPAEVPDRRIAIRACPIYALLQLHMTQQCFVSLALGKLAV